MIKVRLIFGTSNSQPVGGADRDIETVYQNCYKPFIRTLYNAPQIRATLHFSGNLLQWIEHRHSEFIDVLGELTGRKQVEMLGGGFYNPVFSLIPRGDRLGQLERMTTYLRKRFGRRPRGAWVTQGVWDPALPSLLKSSGIEYTFLDDLQFNSGGCDERGFHSGPCITEDEGKTVEVFPLSSEIVNALFTESPEAVLAMIRSRGKETEPAVVSLIFDGERLGLDPEESEARAGWLKHFLELLAEHRDEIETIHPGRYVRSNRPSGRGYFTITPYGHLARWMKPYLAQREHDSAASWMNGRGFFRHILTEYPESNLLYSKMQYIHVLVNQIRGDKYRKRLAREELWRGQNHDAYWHTPSGGIYDNRLRKSVYASLIEAEKVTREKGIFIPSIISLDFDMDGVNEYLFQGQEMNAYVHALGGAVFELDYLPKPWNYLDTMSRRRERYHPSDAPEDPYPRNSFVDHFFRGDEGVRRFSAMQHEELGDFCRGLYEVETVHKEDHRLVLTRRGTVRQGERQVPVEIHKTYLFDATGLQVHYSIRNLGEETIEGCFASEINLALPPVAQSAATVAGVDSAGAVADLPAGENAAGELAAVVCRDYVHGLALQVDAPGALRFWTLPVETAFLSRGELTREYQATCVVPQWELSLAPGELFDSEVGITLGQL
mgnify:CR=1 FL=1